MSTRDTSEAKYGHDLHKIKYILNYILILFKAIKSWTFGYRMPTYS